MTQSPEQPDKGKRHIVQGLLFTDIALKYIKFFGKILNNMTYKSTDICEAIV